jgi:hypothetical protein
LILSANFLRLFKNALYSHQTFYQTDIYTSNFLKLPKQKSKGKDYIDDEVIVMLKPSFTKTLLSLNNYEIIERISSKRFFSELIRKVINWFNPSKQTL